MLTPDQGQVIDAGTEIGSGDGVVADGTPNDVADADATVAPDTPAPPDVSGDTPTPPDGSSDAPQNDTFNPECVSDQDCAATFGDNACATVSCIAFSCVQTDLIGERLSGGAGSDRWTAAHVTSAGEVLLTGVTTSKGAGGFDAWIAHADVAGALRWEQTRGDGGNEIATAITAADDGTVILGGADASGGFLAAHAPDGAPLWRVEAGHAVASLVTFEGAVWAGGWEGTTPTLWRVDPADGSLLDTWPLGVQGRIHAIAAVTSGEIWVAGFSGAPGATSPWLAQVSSGTVALTAETGTLPGDIHALHLDEDLDRAVVAGHGADGAFVAAFARTDGVLSWQRRVGPDAGQGLAIVGTGDYGYAFGGVTGPGQGFYGQLRKEGGQLWEKAGPAVHALAVLGSPQRVVAIGATGDLASWTAVDGFGGDTCSTTSACFTLTPGDCLAGTDACQSVTCDATAGCQTEAVGCDDGNPCTLDGCDPVAGCDNTPVAPGTSCDDGDACTTGETCEAGLCTGGGPLDCDDGNPCTVAIGCDAGVCQQENVAGACDDGDGCTENDVCVDGTCTAGTPIDCDDNNPCTEDLCMEGSCVPNPAPLEGVDCDDNDACTLGDVCGGGACAGTQDPCDDDNPCTDSDCDTATGCLNSTIPLDGSACNAVSLCATPGTCASGVCEGSVSVVCDDGFDCTVDTCDPANGECEYTPTDSLCDDGNVCTDDFCDANVGCDATDNAALCDDDNPCTINDMCAGGACAGPDPADCDDGQPCTVDGCNPTQGGCTNIDVGDGGQCDDGDPCTLSDSCQGGVCDGTAIDCDDGLPCTVDSCDSGGACQNTPATLGTACDDNDACTENEACNDAGQCGGGTAVVCADDNDACTGAPTCETVAGCVYPQAADGTNCDDGDTCTAGDVCTAGVCAGTSACDDGIACTVDTCDLGSPTGCLHVPDNTLCDDGDDCTSDDCQIFPLMGCLNLPVPDVDMVSCDDGNACTQDTVCQGGQCAGGTATVCDDADDCTTDACDPTLGSCVFAPAGWEVVTPENPNGRYEYFALEADGSVIAVGSRASPSTGPLGLILRRHDATGSITVDSGIDGPLTPSNPVSDGAGGYLLMTTQVAFGAGVQFLTTMRWFDAGLNETNSMPFGTISELPIRLVPLEDGRYAVLSQFGFGGAARIHVAIINADGSEVWGQALDSPSNDNPGGMIQLANGNLAITGTRNGELLMMIVDVDDGTILRQRSVDWLGVDQGFTLAETSDGGLLVGGYTAIVPDALLLKVDDDLQMQWHQIFAGAGVDRINSIAPLADGGFVMGGVRTGDGDDGWIASLDPNGKIRWERTVGGDQDDHILWVAQGADGSIYAAGFDNAAGSPSPEERSFLSRMTPWGRTDCVAGSPCNTLAVADCAIGECGFATCDDASGCLELTKGDGSPCYDGDGCSAGDFCVSGTCTSGSDSLNCGENYNVCAAEQCVSAAGGCVDIPATGSCDDGNPCTTNDACDEGDCEGGGPAADGTACEDGSPCTQNETCQAGSCVAGIDNCDDGDQCTLDTCSPTGSCSNVLTPGLPCEDGSLCTENDACDSGGTCIPGSIVNCDDGTSCTQEICGPLVGCTYTNLDGIDCSVENPCTENNVCFGGTCSAGTDKCDDGDSCTVDSCDPTTGQCTNDSGGGGASYVDYIEDQEAPLDSPGELGASVAVDGEWMVVGQPSASAQSGSVQRVGAALVYRRVAGTWTYQTTLTPTGPGAENTFFGAAVAVEEQGGNSVHVVVGAPGSALSGTANAGAVYIFLHDPDFGMVWADQTETSPDHPKSGAAYGAAVAIDDGAIFVGEPMADANYASDNGIVHQFSPYLLGYQFDGWIAASDPPSFGPKNRFGSSLAIENDLLVVGAPGKGFNTGGAYAFTQDDPLWTESGILDPQNMDPLIVSNAMLGTSVATSDNRIAVGAPFAAFLGGPQTGGVLIFEGPPWAEASRAEGSTSGAEFGRSVALVGDTLFVGAPKDVDSNGQASGLVHVLEYESSGGPGDSWSGPTEESPFGVGSAGGEFGFACAFDSGTLVVGAPNEFSNEPLEGLAYHYEVCP